MSCLAMDAPFEMRPFEQGGCHGCAMIIEAMAKRTDLSPADAGRSFGVGRLTRHLFVCLGPDCADLADGERTWVYLKRRMKELNITGPEGPFYRTKCQCLRICTTDRSASSIPRARGTGM